MAPLLVMNRIAHTLWVTLGLVALCPALGLAQRDASPRKRVRDAEFAYDQGVKSYTRGEYADAGSWFEEAYRLAPAASARIQAVKAFEKAGKLKRAATLAWQVKQEYPALESAQAGVREVLERAKKELVRVSVDCRDCVIEMDNRRLPFADFFTAPKQRHHMQVIFPTGMREYSFSRRAGKVVELTFTPPRKRQSNGNADDLEGADADQGLHPAFALTGMGLTAGALGFTIWSAVNKDGSRSDRRLRTGLGIGISSGLAITTFVLAMFSDWSFGSDEADTSNQTQAWIQVDPSHAIVGVTGSF